RFRDACDAARCRVYLLDSRLCGRYAGVVSARAISCLTRPLPPPGSVPAASGCSRPGPDDPIRTCARAAARSPTAPGENPPPSENRSPPEGPGHPPPPPPTASRPARPKPRRPPPPSISDSTEYAVPPAPEALDPTPLQIEGAPGTKPQKLPPAVENAI